MDEDVFWTHLEFRLCDEFKGMGEGNLRVYWCDGFIPEAYLIQDETPKITGGVWIAKEQEDQREWRFELFLPRRFSAIEEIDWEELLPPDNVTKWLAFDPESRRIQIEPAAAVPDL